MVLLKRCLWDGRHAGSAPMPQLLLQVRQRMVVHCAYLHAMQHCWQMPAVGIIVAAVQGMGQGEAPRELGVRRTNHCEGCDADLRVDAPQHYHYDDGRQNSIQGYQFAETQCHLAA